MPNDNLVQVKVHDFSGTIVLDRPARRNALSRDLLVELEQAFQDLHQQASVRAVILTGAGTSFCAGADLHEIHQTAQQDDAESQWFTDALAYRSVLQTMLRFPKPIIASVNGPALGGGAGLVLASDVVVASPEAEFSVPAPKLGLVAGLVAPLLTFRIGGGWGARILLTGERLQAEDALRLAIYQEVVPADFVWARAHELAGDFAKMSHEALAMTKRMVNETIGEHLDTLLSAGAAVMATSRTTDASREGVAAFIEKREPSWP